MFSVRLLFVVQAIFLLPLLLHHTCNAKAICTSSCGNIHNINYPFRLNTDSKYCGGKSYILVCENNFTVLYLNSVKYYVKAINYSSLSIRVVDAEVDKENYCSIPRHSLPPNLDSDTYYYNSDIYWNWNMSSLLKKNVHFYTMSLAFINCENPVNSPYYVDSSTCSSSWTWLQSKGFSYVKVSQTNASELPDSCRVDLIYEAVLPININNISYKDIHEGMVHGFELSWDPPYHLSFVENLIRSIIFAIDNMLLVLSGGQTRDKIDDSDARYFLIKTLLYDPIPDKVPIWLLLAITFLRHIAPFVLYHTILFIFGAPWIIAFLIYKWRKRHLSVYNNIEEFLQIHNNFKPIRYSYSEIKNITKGFKEKLGEGGYGNVYKGRLRSGYFVAVKMLDKSRTNGQDFINEVGTIGRIHHANIVQLIGFCVEKSERALVYEFMPNGSLDKYIFTQEGRMCLSTEKMYEISLGVARGIEYLHEGCQMHILHFDIKPHNILLDGKFNPKISDFGLAKLYKINNSIVSLTAARGTIGYMAPELFYRSIGGISFKVDIYSFGMLLMEMAGRRKNLNTLVQNSSQLYFPSWVHDHFSKGNDIELEGATENEKIITKRMIIVALWCIQLLPSDRPSMHKVIEMLGGDVVDLQMPPKPSFGPAEMPIEKCESSTTQTSLIDSQNDYTNSINLVIDVGN